MRRDEHIYNTHLDFGLLGELPVEVFYTYQQAMRSNDPYQAQESGGATVCAVTATIEGKEVNVTDYVTKNLDLLQDLEYECSEDYRG